MAGAPPWLPRSGTCRPLTRTARCRSLVDPGMRNNDPVTPDTGRCVSGTKGAPRLAVPDSQAVRFLAGGHMNTSVLANLVFVVAAVTAATAPVWWEARDWIAECLAAECPPDQGDPLSGVGPPTPYASGCKDPTEVGRAQPRYREPTGLYDMPFAASTETIGSTSAVSSEVLAQPATSWSRLIPSMTWRDSDREIGAELRVLPRLRAGSCV